MAIPCLCLSPLASTQPQAPSLPSDALKLGRRPYWARASQTPSSRSSSQDQRALAQEWGSLPRVSTLPEEGQSLAFGKPVLLPRPGEDPCPLPASTVPLSVRVDHCTHVTGPPLCPLESQAPPPSPGQITSAGALSAMCWDQSPHRQALQHALR